MRNRIRPRRPRPSDERGIALVSLLVILSALTILSIGMIVFATTEMQ